jgi:hypothetical protein
LQHISTTAEILDLPQRQDDADEALTRVELNNHLLVNRHVNFLARRH